MRGITFRFVASSGIYFAQDMCTCTLSVVHKDARIARNPRTGESVEVDAKNAVKCKFGKAIKDAVNA